MRKDAEGRDDEGQALPLDGTRTLLAAASSSARLSALFIRLFSAHGSADEEADDEPDADEHEGKENHEEQRKNAVRRSHAAEDIGRALQETENSEQHGRRQRDGPGLAKPARAPSSPSMSAPRRQSFYERRVDDATTVIRGRSPALGAFALLGGMTMSGLLLLPFSFGFHFGLLGIAFSVAIGLGYGHRVVIAPTGITINSTWLCVPISRHHASLNATVDDYIPWESDEPEGVGIDLECLPVSARDRDALKEALWSAIDRARNGAPTMIGSSG